MFIIIVYVCESVSWKSLVLSDDPNSICWWSRTCLGYGSRASSSTSLPSFLPSLFRFIDTFASLPTVFGVVMNRNRNRLAFSPTLLQSGGTTCWCEVEDEVVRETNHNLFGSQPDLKVMMIQALFRSLKFPTVILTPLLLLSSLNPLDPDTFSLSLVNELTFFFCFFIPFQILGSRIGPWSGVHYRLSDYAYLTWFSSSSLVLVSWRTGNHSTYDGSWLHTTWSWWLLVLTFSGCWESMDGLGSTTTVVNQLITAIQKMQSEWVDPSLLVQSVYSQRCFRWQPWLGGITLPSLSNFRTRFSLSSVKRTPTSPTFTWYTMVWCLWVFGGVSNLLLVSSGWSLKPKIHSWNQENDYL